MWKPEDPTQGSWPAWLAHSAHRLLLRDVWRQTAQEDVRFVSIDLEYNDTYVTELGITTGIKGKDFTTYHFVVDSHYRRKLRPKEYGFGKSISVHKATDLVPYLEEICGHHLRSSARRLMVLIGFDIAADLKVLEKHCRWTPPDGIRIIDVQCVTKTFLLRDRGVNLKDSLKAFNVTVRKSAPLHCAGNDAAYTLDLLFTKAGRDAAGLKPTCANASSHSQTSSNSFGIDNTPVAHLFERMSVVVPHNKQRTQSSSEASRVKQSSRIWTTSTSKNASIAAPDTVPLKQRPVFNSYINQHVSFAEFQKAPYGYGLPAPYPSCMASLSTKLMPVVDSQKSLPLYRKQLGNFSTTLAPTANSQISLSDKHIDNSMELTPVVSAQDLQTLCGDEKVDTSYTTAVSSCSPCFTSDEQDSASVSSVAATISSMSPMRSVAGNLSSLTSFASSPFDKVLKNKKLGDNLFENVSFSLRFSQIISLTSAFADIPVPGA